MSEPIKCIVAGCGHVSKTFAAHVAHVSGHKI
jgi:hypothetical protein